jgi:sec-independent protein translocase protein TatA
MGLENPLHIAILLVIVLLVFGAKRLPEMGRSLGSGMREFKDSLTNAGSHDDDPPLPGPTVTSAEPTVTQSAGAPTEREPANS